MNNDNRVIRTTLSNLQRVLLLYMHCDYNDECIILLLALCGFQRARRGEKIIILL